jgi:LEA14-like dessication related protein
MFHKLLLLILTFTLTGCGLIGKKLDPPKVKVQEVKINKVESGKVWLDLILSVQNPNNIDFTVDSLEYTLEVDSKKVISDKHTEDIKISANQVSLAAIPLQLKIEDIISSALTLLVSKTLPYRASGNVKVGPFKIPFNEGGKLDISDL